MHVGHGHNLGEERSDRRHLGGLALGARRTALPGLGPGPGDQAEESILQLERGFDRRSEVDAPRLFAAGEVDADGHAVTVDRRDPRRSRVGVPAEDTGDEHHGIVEVVVHAGKEVRLDRRKDGGELLIGGEAHDRSGRLL
jgi:hypothetical protein